MIPTPLYISSQEFANIRRLAAKTADRQKRHLIRMVAGELDGRPVYAITNGHHSWFAARITGDNVAYSIDSTYNEAEFRQWCLEHRIHGHWFDLDTGEDVPTLVDDEYKAWRAA